MRIYYAGFYNNYSSCGDIVTILLFNQSLGQMFYERIH